jgi:hypothetical protein
MYKSFLAHFVDEHFLTITSQINQPSDKLPPHF